MDPTLPPVAPKKFPRGLIIGGIVVSLVIIIAVGLWLLGFFDSSPSPMSPGPSLSPMSPGPSPPAMSPGQSPQAMSPGQSPQAPQPPTPPPPQQQPQQQPQPPPPSCPPGYNLNTSDSPGYATAAPIGLDSNYCVMTLTKPSSVSSWPLCPPNNTGPIQYDSVHENCYVPKVG